MALENPRHAADITFMYANALQYHDYDRPRNQLSMQASRTAFEKTLNTHGVKEMVNRLAVAMIESEIYTLSTAASSRLIDYTNFPIVAERSPGYTVEVDLSHVERSAYQEALRTALLSYDNTEGGINQLSYWVDGTAVTEGERDSFDIRPQTFTQQKRKALTIHTALVVLGWEIPSLTYIQRMVNDGYKIHNADVLRTTGSLPSPRQRMPLPGKP